jgi:probable HAF family extracellular repeat protein
MRRLTYTLVFATLVSGCGDSPEAPSMDQDMEAAIEGPRENVTVTMIELGTLGGLGSLAYDVNDSGQVTGHSDHPDGLLHAFRWSASTGMEDLGEIGNWSQGLGINRAGDVTGYASFSPDGHAFRWTTTTGIVDLGILSPFRDYSAAWGGINDSGYIAGESYTAAGNLHAVRWSPNGVIQDLGALPGGQSSQALAINNRGWVTGSALTSAGQLHAFLWKPSTGMVSMGALGGTGGYATDVNDNGAVSGVRITGKTGAVFRSAGGSLILLPVLAANAASRAISLNNAGTVVGWSGSQPNTGQGTMHAFAWRSSFGLVDLHVGPWLRSVATRISNTNWIAGFVSGPHPVTGICCIDRAVVWRVQ